MLKFMNKYFNNDNNACTNKQVIGYEELFRGVILKEKVMLNQKKVDFRPCNKVVVKMCLKYYHESWKRRCVFLYDPLVQREVFK